jgi:hypothetical protein
MKKLFTIICAFSLIMAFTLPAMALDDIEDNQAGVALLGQTNQAQKGGEIDNDGLDVDTGDIASGNLSGNTTTTDNGDDVNVDVKTGDLLSGNTDDHSNNSTNTSDADGTDVDVTTGDLLSNNDSHDWTQTNTATDSFKTEDNDGTDVDVALDDINVSDIANDKSYDDNDLLDNKGGKIEVSDIANDKSQDNDDSSTNDSYNNNSQDNDDSSINTDVAVHDINVSDVANDKSDDDLLDVEGDIKVSDIANDKSQDNDDNSTNDSNNDDHSINTDNSEDNDVAVDVAFDDVVDMEGNDAAAAFGGTAIAVGIDDIELNLASTTSVSGIYQNSQYEANAGALFGEAETEFKSECLHVDAKVEGNTGITGANFSAGNFNNQANLNNVTMTIQY